MDFYHQKKIAQALSVLLKAKAEDAFVIFEEKKTGKYVQFAGSVREPLLIDLPTAGLGADEMKRASLIFTQLGARQPETHPLYTDQTATVPAGKMTTFSKVMGRDVRSTAAFACSIFRDVYQFPPDFQLVIKRNPPSFLEKLRRWL